MTQISNKVYIFNTFICGTFGLTAWFILPADIELVPPNIKVTDELRTTVDVVLNEL